MSALVDALHSIRIFFTSNLGLKASALGIKTTQVTLSRDIREG